MILHRLVYYSRNRVSQDGRFRSEIDRILAASRRNNEAVGITGVLMFNAGYFAQALEGERAVVEATFERIQQDERHGEVYLLAFGPVGSRVFGNWSMGIVGASPTQAERFAYVGADSGFDLSAMDGDRVLAALRQLSETEHVPA